MIGVEVFEQRLRSKFGVTPLMGEACGEVIIVLAGGSPGVELYSVWLSRGAKFTLVVAADDMVPAYNCYTGLIDVLGAS